MITTEFYNPTLIQQVHDTDSIPWEHSERVISPDEFAVTLRPLYSISGLWQERFWTETSQLWTTEYNFVPLGATVVGVELKLNTMRLARVQDLIIQLCLNGIVIGDNRANALASDAEIYGAPDDLWGATLTIDDVANRTFGVLISLRSNATMPHRDLGYVDQIALRVYYV